MSNLKVQTIHHVLGNVDYMTTTNNSKKDLQIGVGNSPENFIKVVEIDNLGNIQVTKEINCPGISGYADSATYTEESKSSSQMTIDQYYTNTTEFVQELVHLKGELVNEDDPPIPDV